MTNRYPTTAAHRPVRRRNTQKSTPHDKNYTVLLLRFCTCMLVIAAAVIYKYALPDRLSAFTDRIDRYLYGNVDYRSALSVMGKAVSGEQRAAEAIPEAWSYAFGIQENAEEDNIIEASVIEEPEPELTEIPVISGASAADPAEVIPEEPEPEEEVPANDAISAFLLKQEEFSGIDLPENVTYEMPPIGFEYGLPADGIVSSSFGYRVHPLEDRVIFHYGTDIAASEGTAIYSFADGKVYAVGQSTGYGNYIIIEHADGVKTQYSHCSVISASQGSNVKMGDEIAKVGSTGNATSACLHFEITVDGRYVNPEFYLTWDQKR